ncbi:MAG: hypothetical protein DRI69_03700 [Bacteroidetes bacterium]|nr:MAG: hypothetical protein DRI69_03700 [Bacteroidota bacterium]
MRCDACHTTSSWEIDFDSLRFDHSTTDFAMEGQHEVTDCKMCHSTLVFSNTSQECISCHTDMHQQSLGQDCARCHTATSWIVDNISDIHEQISFPLLGAHATPNCYECHTSETDLRFEPIGVECITCHEDNYAATTTPNHKAASYSLDCSECHSIDAFEWSASGINHDFFPLTLGHDIADCAKCHTDDDFSMTSPECISCHQDDFDNASNPNHIQADFSTDCAACHTTDPDWQPAEFRDHDGLYFPIYSGEHGGEWNLCTECHLNPDNFSEFSCIDCHEHSKADTDDEHEGVTGYAYTSQACFACHPDGRSDGALDHNFFPLTLGHDISDCASCHLDPDFSTTSPECQTCHQMDFDQAQNPNHQSLNLSMDCVACHTTNPDWNPATFDNHSDFYVLNGAHAVIANDCAACHNGDYNNTPNTCFGCHEADYNQTTQPNHQDLQFSTDCISCHSEDAWSPATFDHDGQYFPIYSGSHAGEWAQCLDCHTTPGDYSIFTCITCHESSETADEHTGVDGYSYNSNACLACHPTGESDDAFDHNMTDFPLTGAHVTVECLSCHEAGFEGTSTICVDCHTVDFEQTVNPNHTVLGLSTDCAACHTTAPDWNPATFDNHNDYYVLAGAHTAIANDCAACHSWDFNNTPNTCFGCHEADYNATIDPDHQALQFSTDCITCHSESVWEPSTFDHDGQFFPIYSGSHAGEWDQCLDCHTTPGDFSIFTCVTCHTASETEEEHDGVGGYFYNSDACLACHPTGEGDDGFDHNMTAFPLTGAHITVDCLSCHDSGFEGTSPICAECHTEDFNESTNPNHGALNLSTDCAMCHTTAPDWNPATFENHNDFYVLEGAHVAIANDCASCHNGEYNTTPNTCFGCHEADYNETVDPNHQALQFSTDCISCHTENVWVPSTFDHDGQYFPIYSGEHAGEWDQCLDCHITPGDFSIFSCTTCHEQGETAEEHDGVGGYFYNSDACLACHPTGDGDDGFDHNMTGFPLTGAHISVDCNSCHEQEFEGTSTICVDCHNMDFDESTNPNHGALNLSTDCVMCHTTAPDWNPATFDNHDDFYILAGAHVAIANDCAACHNGDYNSTPGTCFGCHESDYNETAEPNHMVAQFSTECATCHTENTWIPSTFDHDGQYFPINSGAHNGVWDQCSECHTNPGDYGIVTCTTCHMEGETADEHVGVAGYNFNSSACLACHPTGEAEGALDHNMTDFPLTGAHLTVDCFSCHDPDFGPLSTECSSCHLTDYNESTNPNHGNLGLSTDCVVCHTTDPDWSPATFDVHNDYYVLNGAHAEIATDCAACHNGDYNNTPNTCFGCHETDYNQTTNPPHASLQFETDCATCHSESAWTPSTFDHDGPYFPIYSGAHGGVWDQCSECHTNPNDYGIFTCTTCHMEGETADEHATVSGYIFNSNACLACHPTGESEGAFDHNTTDFPLTGAHVTVNCFSCHDPDFSPLSTECSSCHLADYDGSTNPNHSNLGLSTDCVACHTTDPEWNPATFDIHNDFYALNGAHAAIASQCATCHNGDYNNTPNTCFGCHEADYNATINPDHATAQFPTDCASCHTETVWIPSTFDHDGMYFPIYSGKHEGEWNQCTECHTNPNDYSIFDCLGCHTNPETDEDHSEVPDYEYNSNACLSCHPTGDD